MQQEPPPVLKSSTSLGWDNYWQNLPENSAFEQGGPSEVVLAAEWSSFFLKYFVNNTSISILDVGCGNGVVTRAASCFLRANKNNLVELHCLDLSENAIESIHSEFPLVKAITADANGMPYPDQFFDLVVSQFGVEYAGLSGVKESIRVLADGGTLMFIMHLEDGKIYQESVNNLSLIKQFFKTEFIACSRGLFKAGYELLENKADDSDFHKADKKLSLAVENVKKLLTTVSKQGYGANFVAIYRDIAHMCGNMESYNPLDVFSWLDRIEIELHDYFERTEAMVEVAMDKNDFEKLTTLFEKQGLRIQLSKILKADQPNSDFAYLIQCRKLPVKAC